MTKIAKVVTALALSASMAFGVVSLAACGNNEQEEEHKHSYATTWSSDADNHWHAPACDDTTEVKDKAAHVDADSNGKCDVCNHDVPLPHEHTYATTWSSDATNHWHAPTCDDTTELKDKAAHVDENNDYKCDVCNYSLPVPHQHEYAEQWSNDEEYHWHAPTCNDTTDVKDKAAHIDEDGNEKCDVCDYKMPHEHKYAEEWTTDEDYHWHAPTCGDTEELKDRAEHVDEDEDYKCDVCNYDLPKPEEGEAITIVANGTADIEINLEAGTYELCFTLDNGVTATQGGLTAHVNGSTYKTVYDMYEGLHETYYAVLFVLDDSTAITLTNTTGEDISAHYTLEEYEAPLLKADGNEYVVPRLYYIAAHSYRGLFIPVEPLTGEYKITINHANTSVFVYKNGGATSVFATLTASKDYSATVDFTGIESLNFRSGNSSYDYNITVKIESVA